MKLKLLFLQTVLHLIVWYAGPGQNNNANFDTDVEAGGASEDENQVRKFFRRILPCPHLRSPSHLRAFLGSGFVLSFSSTATSKLILNSIICNPSSDIPETFYPVKNQSTIQPEPMANPQRSNTTVKILGLRALK